MKKIIIVCLILGLGLPLVAMYRAREDDDEEVSSLRRKYDNLDEDYEERVQIFRKLRENSPNPDEQKEWREIGVAERYDDAIIRTILFYLLPFKIDLFGSEELPCLIEKTERRRNELAELIEKQYEHHERATAKLSENGIDEEIAITFRAYTTYVEDREPFLNDLNEALRNYSDRVHKRYEMSKPQQRSYWDIVFTYLLSKLYYF